MAAARSRISLKRDVGVLVPYVGTAYVRKTSAQIRDYPTEMFAKLFHNVSYFFGGKYLTCGKFQCQKVTHLGVCNCFQWLCTCRPYCAKQVILNLTINVFANKAIVFPIICYHLICAKGRGQSRGGKNSDVTMAWGTWFSSLAPSK